MKPRALAMAASLGAVLVVAVTWSFEASALVRDGADQELVDRERAHLSESVALLEKGEALATAGSLEQAASLFQEGAALYPYLQGLLERRECEVLTSLNRREEAQKACWHAVMGFRTPATIEAATRALVAGPTKPTFDELVKALSLVVNERHRAPGTPQLSAAMCDIAESIGDATMLQHCSEELERSAPNYEATRRARHALAAACPPGLFWAGWLAIAACVGGTAADAFRRGARRQALHPIRSAAALAFLLCFSFGLSARAEGKWLSSWPVDDADPVKSVPSNDQLKADPLQAGYFLQDLISKAEGASKAGEHGVAEKFYEAIFKMVPKRSLALTKMCDEFEAMGNLAQATNACGLALSLDGVTVGDYAHFVRLVLHHSGDLSPKEVAAVTSVIDHMKADDNGRLIGNQLQCEVAARTGDMGKLQECSGTLVALAPNDGTTILYQWEVAVREHNFAAAHDLLARAKTAGLSADRLAHMEKAMQETQNRRREFIAVATVGFLAFVGSLVYTLTLFFSRRRSPVTTPGSPAAA
jgi:exonuclease VII small subunit